MQKKLITNARIINEGREFLGSILIMGELIAEVWEDAYPDYQHLSDSDLRLDAQGKILMPGIIDDQVHFREPGLTQKADIASESRAAVAGGITSFMEMPNTMPQTTTIELLKEKFKLGATHSMANYSFYMGATNENLQEIVKIDPSKVCGIKVFMGSSTGNMLVDKPEVLEAIFQKAPCLIAVHCEDEETIQKNLKTYKEQYGEDIQPNHHPEIRSDIACYKSSQLARQLAEKHNTRLHILHLSTALEADAFTPEKTTSRISGEICVHHLWFSQEDYANKGNFIKWNPAIKSKQDREALWKALLEERINVIATDHAPHLLEEKQKQYLQAPSGGPLVQHALQCMIDACNHRNIPLSKMVAWMCHNPALCFGVEKRGFIRKGYFADLVLVDPKKPYTVSDKNILYKCGWSPFEGQTFSSTPTHTFINGQLVYEKGHFNEKHRGKALKFLR